MVFVRSLDYHPRHILLNLSSLSLSLALSLSLSLYLSLTAKLNSQTQSFATLYCLHGQ